MARMNAESYLRLTDLPAELMQEVVSRLDIRSAGRLARTGKSFAVGNSLLQSHPDYSFFSAIQGGDSAALPAAFSRIVSRPCLGARNVHQRRFVWRANDNLMSLLEACIWTLLVDRNNDNATLWAPIHFLVEKHRPTLVSNTRSVHLERAVIEAYRRNHFRAIIAFGQLASSDGAQFCTYSLLLWPIVKEICARKPNAGTSGTQSDFSAKLKLDLLQAMLLLLEVSDISIKDFVFGIAHPNNSMAAVVHLALKQFESWSDYTYQCLILLLDACGKHNRPDMFSLVLQIYLLGLNSYQPSPSFMGTEYQDPPRPNVIFPQPTDDLFYSIQARMSVYGVVPSATLQFRNLLAECSWHHVLIPWILGIAGTPGHPHLALDWLLSHVRINLAMIHYLPLAIHAPLGHLQPDALGLLLGKFPIDMPPGASQHGPRDARLGVSALEDESRISTYESHADHCRRCRDIVAFAAAEEKRTAASARSGSAKDTLFKEIVEQPAHWHVSYDARPDAIVREEMAAVRALLIGSVKSSHAPAFGSGASDWALADWANGFLTGDEVYQLWVATEQVQATALPFPISFGAAMNALVELHDFEHTLVLLEQMSDGQAGGDPRNWVVTERAVEAIIQELEAEDGKCQVIAAEKGVCRRFISEVVACTSMQLSFQSEKARDRLRLMM